METSIFRCANPRGTPLYQARRHSEWFEFQKPQPWNKWSLESLRAGSHRGLCLVTKADNSAIKWMHHQARKGAACKQMIRFADIPRPLTAAGPAPGIYAAGSILTTLAPANGFNDGSA